MRSCESCQENANADLPGSEEGVSNNGGHDKIFSTISSVFFSTEEAEAEEIQDLCM